MLTRPSWLLRGEGAVWLVASVVLYRQMHASWGLFALLFLAPDLFMLGYLANVRVGAAVYNFAHTLLLPGLLLGISVVAARPQLVSYALIWIAHIGIDRLLGFGLKYPTRFKDTHLQHV